jgi:hypothetical protein
LFAAKSKIKISVVRSFFEREYRHCGIGAANFRRDYVVVADVTGHDRDVLMSGRIITYNATADRTTNVMRVKNLAVAAVKDAEVAAELTGK